MPTSRTARPSGSPVITARDLTFTWPDGSLALPPLTLDLHRGQLVGLVGANGTGKSTLLRLLAGELSPTGGRLDVAGAIGFLRQDLLIRAGATVAEALGIAEVLAALERLAGGDTSDVVYETIGNAWDIREHAEESLARLGLAGLVLERPLATLSGGELMRIRLGALLRREPTCLLLDEPTNHLDTGARAAVYEALAQWRGAALIASHDRELLARVDKIFELRGGKLRAYGGAFDDFDERRKLEAAATAAQLQAARQDLQRTRHKAAEAGNKQRHRMAQGSSHWQGQRERFVGPGRSEQTLIRQTEVHAKRMQAATAHLATAKAAARTDKRLAVDLPKTAVPSDKLIVELNSVNLRGLWQKPLDAVVAGPSRVALTGANGTGKTTLLHHIAATAAVDLGTAFLDQRLAHLDPAASAAAHARRLAPNWSETARRTHLGRFLIGEALGVRPLVHLSGGERLRAALALALMGDLPARLLLLDEPTNHLDLPSVEILEAALASYRGALIVVSHDATFVERIGVDMVWELTGEGMTVRHLSQVPG